jgi:hypothetical protein
MTHGSKQRKFEQKEAKATKKKSVLGFGTVLGHSTVFRLRA